MSKLIFITGFRGSGKSHASKEWAVATNAVWICGDHLFSTSLTSLRPELSESDGGRKNDWNEWPRQLRTKAVARNVLESTIHRAAYYLDTKARILPADVNDYRGHILADGAIFANDWFREATIEVLGSFGHVFNAVHYLYSNPPDAVILARIRERGRVDEIDVFREVETVTMQNNGFRSFFGASRPLWTVLTTSESVDAEFRRLLCPES